MAFLICKNVPHCYVRPGLNEMALRIVVLKRNFDLYIETIWVDGQKIGESMRVVCFESSAGCFCYTASEEIADDCRKICQFNE